MVDMDKGSCLVLPLGLAWNQDLACLFPCCASLSPCGFLGDAWQRMTFGLGPAPPSLFCPRRGSGWTLHGWLALELLSICWAFSKESHCLFFSKKPMIGEKKGFCSSFKAVRWQDSRRTQGTLPCHGLPLGLHVFIHPTVCSDWGLGSCTLVSVEGLSVWRASPRVASLNVGVWAALLEYSRHREVCTPYRWHTCS